MAHSMFWALLLMAVVVSAPSARADYQAGQRAWDAGCPDAALTQWRSAAASGDRRAMLALGRLLVQGRGVPQHYVEAHKWLNLAASRGERAALKERDALAKKMTAEQVAAAQEQAKAWRPVKGGLVPAMAELFMLGSKLNLLGEDLLGELMEAPEKLERFGRELQKLGGGGAAPAISFKPKPKSKCAGAAKETPGWKDVANKPGCRVWAECYDPDRTVTWSGICSGGFADGQGTLEVSKGEGTHTGTGTYSNGKAHGRWVWRLASGTVAEGPLVDGEMHDRWVLRFASGQVEEGPFVDGKRHGRWNVRFAKGTLTGPFVDGEMHGRWVLRYANGTVAEGPLVDGKPHGRWRVRHHNGKDTETVFVDGRPGC